MEVEPHVKSVNKINAGASRRMQGVMCELYTDLTTNILRHDPDLQPWVTIQEEEKVIVVIPGSPNDYAIGLCPDGTFVYTTYFLSRQLTGTEPPLTDLQYIETANRILNSLKKPEKQEQKETVDSLG